MVHSILAVWPFEEIGHLIDSAKHDYGVNPYIYLFIWWIAAAPPWYIGLHWVFKGLARSDHQLFRRGVLLNRLGYALAPAYVLASGHSLGWVTYLWIVVPLVFSWWFYKYRLLNPKWVKKNQGRITSIAGLIEDLITLRWGRVYRRLTHNLYQPRLVEPGTPEYEQALEVERKVFEEEKYPYDYQRYNQQSRMLAVMDGETVAGVVRLIQATPELLPPVLSECSVDEIEYWKRLALEGNFEELSTAAVAPEYRGKKISPELYRFAIPDAGRRGVIYWGVIEEWDRVEKMNTLFRFTFEPIGEEGFHDWPCTPCVLNINESVVNMGLGKGLKSWLLFRYFTRYCRREARVIQQAA